MQGNTPFGRFLSAGRLDSTDDGGLRLTLARRYLDDGDPRANWSVAKVAGELRDDTREVAAAGPWRAKAMRLHVP